MGCSALEPNAHDVHMYKGAVSDRAESILRSTDASALGNRVQCFNKEMDLCLCLPSHGMHGAFPFSGSVWALTSLDGRYQTDEREREREIVRVWKLVTHSRQPPYWGYVRAG